MTVLSNSWILPNLRTSLGELNMLIAFAQFTPFVAV